MKSSKKSSKDSQFRNNLDRGLWAMVILFSTIASAAEFRPDEVIVKYRDASVRSFDTMDRIYKSVSASRVQRFRGNMAGLERLYLPAQSNVAASVMALNAQPEVEYAQPNYIVRITPAGNTGSATVTSAGFSRGLTSSYPCLLPGVAFPPGCEEEDIDEPVSTPPGSRPLVRQRPAEVIPPVADPDVNSSYGLFVTKANQAWAVHPGNSNFIVGIIDAGIDYNHRDLAYNVWRNPNPGPKNDVVGYDFVHNDGLPYDDVNHGTHCAGIIGATGMNGIGISGVNQKVSLMALKFVGADGSGDIASAIRAIDYGISHGAKVLSNSWGVAGVGPDQNPALGDAIERAKNHNVLVVAAAGNDTTDNDVIPSIPANFHQENVISVASTTSGDTLSSFSNYGGHSVHLAAPGTGVYSTIPGNRYDRMSGTSMACPYVAGAAALVWSRNPTLTAVQVKARLMSTVDAVPALQGKVISGGRLNVLRALQNSSGARAGL